MTPDAKSDSILTPDINEEADKRTPKMGPFNTFSLGALASAAFGSIGYFLGGWIGNFGDENLELLKGGGPKGEDIKVRKMVTINGVTRKSIGRGEMFGRVIGTVFLGLTGMATTIRLTRDAREQARDLARQNVELERNNEALASTYTQPVGSLIQTENVVSDVKPDGMIADKAQKAIGG